MVGRTVIFNALEMAETLKEIQNRQQTSDIISIQKDVQYLRESMDRNFADHEEIKKIINKGLDSKVGNAKFKPVELITYGMAGGVLAWALGQILGLIQIAKALF